MIKYEENLKNCQCCSSSYAPYKVGTESEIYGAIYGQDMSGWFMKEIPVHGFCPFCNPKSFWYNHCHEHYAETCRVNIHQKTTC